MKILDKISILIFNLCLLFASIIIPALTLASTHEYYYSQFEKNGIYSHIDENGNEKGNIVHNVGGKLNNSAVFSDEQLNIIIDHTVDYLFTDKKDSFALTLDGVYMLSDGYSDGVDIFGETAVSHMKDVKVLMNTAKIAAVICACLAAVLLVVFVVRAREIGRFLIKYTLIFYASLLGFILLFCLFSFFKSGTTDLDMYISGLWGDIHYLLFPFQPEKYANSFFNDTLTEILTVDLFISAVVIVLSITALMLAIWFIAAVMIKKCGEKKMV